MLPIKYGEFVTRQLQVGYKAWRKPVRPVLTPCLETAVKTKLGPLPFPLICPACTRRNSPEINRRRVTVL